MVGDVVRMLEEAVWSPDGMGSCFDTWEGGEVCGLARAELFGARVLVAMSWYTGEYGAEIVESSGYEDGLVSVEVVDCAEFGEWERRWRREARENPDVLDHEAIYCLGEGQKRDFSKVLDRVVRWLISCGRLSGAVEAASKAVLLEARKQLQDWLDGVCDISEA